MVLDHIVCGLDTGLVFSCYETRFIAMGSNKLALKNLIKDLLCTCHPFHCTEAMHCHCVYRLCQLFVMRTTDISEDLSSVAFPTGYSGPYTLGCLLLTKKNTLDIVRVTGYSNCREKGAILYVYQTLSIGRK